MTMNTDCHITFPMLYSQNSNGSIQEWQISVEGSTIITIYGRHGGKLQTTADTIKSGKNLGKANATTCEEQAVAEATSRWEKKLKSGYVQTLTDAHAGSVDSKFVHGGIEPMLAKKFEDEQRKVTYPAFVQPKLDGIRCIAMINNGKASLWSRTRKQINSVPHVVAALENAFTGQTVVLDGELYNHDYRHEFETIVSLVRQEEPKEGCEKVQYHIYDLVDTNMNFSERYSTLQNNLMACDALHLLETHKVDCDSDLADFFAKFQSEGYEGAMYRADAPYECKRSNSLLKMKSFSDSEFVIVDIIEGRGKLSGAAIMVCAMKSGETFNCKMEGSIDNLKIMLTNKNRVIGKLLTVRYQGLTSGNVPRFPIGVAVRDYE